MKLCIDVGNTTIRMGIFAPELTGHFSCDTFNLNANYHHERFDDYFSKIDLSCEKITKIIYSSVVPSIDEMIKEEISKKCPNAEWLNVSISLKHDFVIDVDDENEIGADLFADLVGAKNEYGCPVLIVDIGTATKILLIDKNNVFSTCAILPGLELSAKVLNANTELLPAFRLDNTTKLIDAHNTIDCLVNGVIYGQVGAIKEILNRYENELGYTCTKVITGGASNYLTSLLPKDYIIDDDLIMKGLNVLLETNVEE